MFLIALAGEVLFFSWLATRKNASSWMKIFALFSWVVFVLVIVYAIFTRKDMHS
jgi:ABC-type transport system involved in multi-copper enzyme maturation permease subunit